MLDDAQLLPEMAEAHRAALGGKTLRELTPGFHILYFDPFSSLADDARSDRYTLLGHADYPDAKLMVSQLGREPHIDAVTSLKAFLPAAADGLISGYLSAPRVAQKFAHAPGTGHVSWSVTQPLTTIDQERRWASTFLGTYKSPYHSYTEEVLFAAPYRLGDATQHDDWQIPQEGVYLSYHRI